MNHLHEIKHDREKKYKDCLRREIDVNKLGKTRRK